MLSRHPRPSQSEVLSGREEGVRVHITRDSVCAGDDAKAPNARSCQIGDTWSWPELVGRIWQASDLPSIDGGRATWVLASGILLAVAAQEWDQPHVFFRLEGDRRDLDMAGGDLRAHWSYLAQIDPAMVVQALERIRLRL